MICRLRECENEVQPGRQYCSRLCANRGNASGRYRAASIRIPAEPTDRSYLAAIIDGEGFITARYQRDTSLARAYFVGVTNTDVGLMEWLAGMGGSVLRRNDSIGKQVYVWNVRCAADVLLLLAAVSPYMRIKQEKALAAISDLSVILSLGAGLTAAGLALEGLQEALAAL